jgi:dihydrofolate reductase
VLNLKELRSASLQENATAMRHCAGAAFDTRVKNYVLTRGLPQSPAPPGLEFVNEPIDAFAARLRQKKGKDIWMMGGAGIIAWFLDEGEIDGFILQLIPIFAACGERRPFGFVT